MHVLLITIGSHGDVHPFIGLGLALKSRGHQVTFATNDYFRPLAKRAGFDDFISLGSADEYSMMAKMPELWESSRGVKLIFEFISRGFEDIYKIVAHHHASHPADGVVVSSSLCLGARVAQDKLKFPMATVHLSPSILRSVINPAKLPGLFMPPWFPYWIKAAMWRAADRYGIDPIVCPNLNEFRAKHNLAPVKRPLKDWWHSPDLVLGMWPEWFGPMQPDWPSQTVLCGFPLYDERELEAMPPDLIAFLDAGEKPIAFTPGSAMWRGEEFFKASVEACRKLNRRGLLLSRHADHIPPNLPAGVLHVPYAPFSQLLPRVAALVHHGGIGTTSQALAAGTPQLIMAMSHDQPDNAFKVERLGVGLAIRPARYLRGGAAKSLARLLGN
ncbi:MAG: glycosyltransferase, partial [Phycisphaerae bacterium]|nr:glycosyltransferase [Phycisphaerae bacterium]